LNSLQEALLINSLPIAGQKHPHHLILHNPLYLSFQNTATLTCNILFTISLWVPWGHRPFDFSLHRILKTQSSVLYQDSCQVMFIELIRFPHRGWSRGNPWDKPKLESLHLPRDSSLPSHRINLVQGFPLFIGDM
jgi:hypothetical protein